MKETPKSTESNNEDGNLDPSIEVVQLGVWRVFLERDVAFFDFKARWERLRTGLPTVRRLTRDFHKLEPVLFPLLCLQHMFIPVAAVIKWHLFNRIIFVLEAGLVRGQFDNMAIVQAVVARVMFLIMNASISCWSGKAERIVQDRIVCYFEGLLFEWKSKADLRTVEDNRKSQDELTSINVWYGYRDLLLAAGRSISIIWQLCYMTSLVKTNKEALIYIIIFLVKPFTKSMFQQSIWEKSWIATSNEPNFNRMHALSSMVGNPDYKQEIASNGNITGYFIEGMSRCPSPKYRKARKSLGDASASYPAVQYSSSRERVERTIVSEILGDLHLFYCVYNAILHPSRFALSRIAMLPKAGDAITWEFDSLWDALHSAESSLSTVARIYDLVNVENALKDGDLDYDAKGSSDLGMSLAMKNVEFSYSGDKSDRNALHDVSFSIKPGQFVVIVGKNGSGKSTIVKLLTRLYDCTSGQVLVEGKDIQQYKLAGLRLATAVLTQDHHIYPLSFSENIGLGNTQEVSDMNLIQHAARKGGADTFISEYPRKYDTVLEPMTKELLGGSYSTTDDTALSKIRKTLDPKIDVSGGQRQRVAASRTFMRLTSGNIKLILADEPSSNLDPEGEVELFKNLRKERQGKTMIFVTHRFGYLTQQADLILCMHDGRLVEQGTHAELMAARGKNGEHGEYHKMFHIQAQPFKQESRMTNLNTLESKLNVESYY